VSTKTPEIENSATEVKTPEAQPLTTAERFSRISDEKRKAAAQKRRRKRIIKWSVIGGILIVVALGITFGVYKLFFEPAPAIPDQTTYSYRGSFSSFVAGYGQVKASKSETVMLKVGGNVLDLYVMEGQTVYEGDPLFTIDDADLIKAVDKANEELETLKEQVQSITDSRAEAEKNLADQYKRLSEVRDKIDKLNFGAPFNGKLLRVNIEDGSQVTEGMELGLFADDTQLVLRQYFSYAYETDIFVGQTATVSIPAVMANLDGKVTKIEKVRKVTQEGSVLFAVDVTITNPGALTADMDAIATLRDKNGLAITPSESAKLEYIRTDKLVSPIQGKIIEFKMVEFYDYKAGEIMLRLSDDSYRELVLQIEKTISGIQDSLSSSDKSLKLANEQVLEKHKEIEDLNAQFELLNAVAPMSGTVMGVSISVGTRVEANMPILTISDTSSMTLETNFDERDVTKLKVGQPVELYQDTNEGQRMLFGSIKQISLEGKFDWGYAYFPAIIAIENAEGLYMGSGLRFNIMLDSRTDCILLPVSAVKYTELATCVFVKLQQGEKAPETALELPEGIVPEGYYAVEIITGMSDDAVVEIISGLDEGVEVYLAPGLDPNQAGYYY